MPEQRKASWRGAGKEKSSVPQHRWQEATVQDAGYEAKKLWYRTKIGILAVLALVLIGAFVSVLFFLKPMPVLIAITVTKYDWPLPANSLAKEDYDQIRQLKTVSLMKNHYEFWNPDEKRPFTRKEATDQLAKQLGEYKGSFFKKSKEVVIVYISMHGAVNAEGDPCLLLPHAPALDSSAWLPLRDVVETIETSLPRPVKKLLILDCTRMLSNWNLGLLYNGFADGVKALSEKMEDPNLVILNATSAGEVAWTGPGQLNGSVFGYYVRSALAGEADGLGHRSKDGVTVTELSDYVKTEVNHWVARYRADAQTPQLFPEKPASDFRVAKKSTGMFTGLWSNKKTVSSKRAEDHADYLESGLYQDVKELWSRHADFYRDRAYQTKPIAWQEFEQKLLRLEQLSVAGTAYKDDSAPRDDYRETLKEVKDLANALGSESPYPVAPLSLPLAKHYRNKPLGPVVEAWNKFRSDPSEQSLDQVVRTTETASTTEEELKPGLIEIHFLRMLRRYLDADWRGKNTRLTRAAWRAAQIRASAEQAAAPVDERAHYWIKERVVGADQRRRSAEDHLFVGSEESLDKADKLWDEAERALNEADSDANKVAKALRVRDRAWAELPYWAQWVTRRVRSAADSNEADATDASDLRTLINDVRELTNLLARRADATALVGRADKLEIALEERLQNLKRRCDSLQVSTKRDSAKFREIADILAFPLISGELRQTLLSEYANLFHLDFQEEPVGQRDQEKSAPRYGDRLTSLGEHPAVLILQENSSTAAATETLAKKGEQIRLRMSAISEEARKDRDSQDRQAITLADVLVRRGAVLRADWRDFGEEPARVLQRHDLHALMVWHCERALYDFWGPVSDNTPSYFALAAERYLESAKKLLSADLKDLEKLKDERLKAVHGSNSYVTKVPNAPREQNGFVLEPSILTVLGSEDEDEFSHSVSISQRPELPPGTAAYFVREREPAQTSEAIPMNLSRGGPAVHRRALDIPITEPKSTALGSLQYLLTWRELQRHGEGLQAVVLYRGHEFTKGIAYCRNPGVLIAHDRPNDDAPRVRVLGPPERESVVFIFDCSYSMNKEASVPGAGGREVKRRMQLAKEVFRKILDRLAKDGGYQVGVIFYGHRVRWPQGATQPETNIEFLRKIGKGIELRDVRAGADVEFVLELGRFEEEMKDTPKIAKLYKYLDEVSWWGHTPLYLAITEAAKSLKAANASNPRIIAITDGANDIRVADRDPELKDELKKSKEDVVKACKDPKIPLFILGFNITDPAELREAEESFGFIKTAVGGHCQFLKAPNPDDLMTMLEGSLNLRTYQVRQIGSGDVLEEEVGIESPRLQRKREYVAEVSAADSQARLKSPTMRLEGNEFVQLQVQGDRLTFEGCKGRDPRARRMQEKLAPREEFYIHPHRPEREFNAVTFPICLENTDAVKFTPRPAELWATIKPVDADDPELDRIYTFYDSDFQPDTSVPVMRFKAMDWPKGAQSAKIELWCKRVKTEVGKTVTVRDINRNGLNLSLADARDVRIEIQTMPATQAEPLRLVVTEIHPEGTRNMNALKVELNSPVPAKKITRRFSEKCQVAQQPYHMAKHTFLLDNIRDSNEIQDYQLLFTPQSAIKQDAMHSGELTVALDVK